MMKIECWLQYIDAHVNSIFKKKVDILFPFFIGNYMKCYIELKFRAVFPHSRPEYEDVAYISKLYGYLKWSCSSNNFLNLYIFAITGDNDNSIAKTSSCLYMSEFNFAHKMSTSPFDSVMSKGLKRI